MRFFEKRSYGPPIFYADKSRMGRMLAAYASPAAALRSFTEKELATLPESWKTEGVLVKTNPGLFLPTTGDKLMDHVLTRHELKHWDNFKKGKFQKNRFFDLLKDEFSASSTQNSGAFLKNKLPKAIRLPAIVLDSGVGTLASTGFHYPKTVGLMSGAILAAPFLAKKVYEALLKSKPSLTKRIVDKIKGYLK